MFTDIDVIYFTTPDFVGNFDEQKNVRVSYQYADPFSFTIGPGESRGLELAILIDGRATAAVAEPDSVALLGLALFGLLVFGRHRARA